VVQKVSSVFALQVELTFQVHPESDPFELNREQVEFPGFFFPVGVAVWNWKGRKDG
jgi:hypothetical protein